jgi:hypothetical protein
MSNEFRGSKYVNESGSKRGNWYMNRLDYFQFHEYPAYKKHKFLSLFVGVFFYFIGIEAFKISFLFFIPFIYLCYVAWFTFNLLRTKKCRYRGYFLYPARIVKFFRSIEVEVDLQDFDSVATMSKK